MGREAPCASTHARPCLHVRVFFPASLSPRSTDPGVSDSERGRYIVLLKGNNSCVSVNNVCLSGLGYVSLFLCVSPGRELELETGSQTPSVHQG